MAKKMLFIFFRGSDRFNFITVVIYQYLLVADIGPEGKSTVLTSSRAVYIPQSFRMPNCISSGAR